MMNAKRLLVGLVACSTAAVGVAGCGGEGAGEELDGETATVEYRFGDSSVPPEHHRSYTLTVTAQGARLVVDSYGDVLHDVRQSIDDSVWQRLLDEAADLDADSAGADCTGGTWRELIVTDADNATDDPVLAVEVDVCAGDNEREAEQLEELVQPVLDAFELDVLLATG